MKLQTQIPLSKVNNQIDYNSHILLLGSCFVENIGDKLDYFKFRTLQNPFGILFHPLAIENLILRAVEGRNYTEHEIFNKGSQWLCFDAHSGLSANTKEALIQNLNNALLATKKQITNATHIVITLGTAWVYRNLASENIVANCHKVPQKEFDKELLTVEKITRSLKHIIQLITAVNTKAQIIFTISPVRHLKDGFMENQRSKAHLITAVQGVLEDETDVTLSRVEVFPSYEIMMDELRDYRFYAKDMVHPSEVAIDYIWEKLKSVWISDSTYPVMGEVDIVQKGMSHRPFNPESKEHQKFLQNLEKRKEQLLAKYQHIKF
ncbi:MAG: GSCFA domain-containing protein [Flavobacteriaceae bacterium]|nr:MAG: GSCFA domain-containing protein [Flavobacteriaceae bacterium]